MLEGFLSYRSSEPKLEEVDLLLLEGTHPLFIDKGDGFIGERERVRMFLSLVAHAGGYRMMVGAHSTVGCRMHVGGCVVLFEYGRCWYLLYCLCPEVCEGSYHVHLVW